MNISAINKPDVHIKRDNIRNGLMSGFLFGLDFELMPCKLIHCRFVNSVLINSKIDINNSI